MSNENIEIDYSQISKIAHGIVKRYSCEIDFNEKNFVCIPIDIIESYWEIESIRPLLAGLIDGSVAPAGFQRTVGQLTTRLWHLIGHLNDLDVALKQYEQTT